MPDRLNVLVTGAAGHLGSHLVPALEAAGFRVTGMDIVEPADPGPSARPFVKGGLSDPAALAAALDGVSLICHCASIHPWKAYRDEQYIDSNVKGTWHLYNAASALGITRVVLTSSIAAIGYHNVPVEAWPVAEGCQFPLGDLYSLTKHAQEDIARLFAHLGKVRTVALRPPAFMPVPDMETGFRLTANFAVVDDIASAHVGAARVLAGLQAPGAPLGPFEAFHVTNALPYTQEDAVHCGSDRNIRALVRKYWPDAYDWLIARGYTGEGLVAVYDISRAERILGWRPELSFPQWFAARAD
jgi:nucleoside-diphosphate-sugar epimerase